MIERRRHTRMRLERPLRASCGAVRIYLVDMSDSGMLVVHADELAHSRFCSVEIVSTLGPIRVDCQIVRTQPHHSKGSARPLYQSGLAIVAADHQSRQRLRTFAASVKELEAAASMACTG